MRRSAIEYHKEIATNVAFSSTMRHRVGCVLAGDAGHVTGYNRYLGDPGGKGWSMHAEACAIIRGNKWGSPYKDAFITRVGGGMARPCEKCMAALRRAGVKRVYYTNECKAWVTEAI